MGASSFLPRLEAAFLAIFHPLDGPKVLFQVPENIFVDQRNADASAEPQRHPMLDFASLSEYVIPKAPLCGRLITSEVRSHNPSQHVPRSYKVMGFPVLLEQSEKYQRNYFIFNLCFVFDSRASVSAYEPIVRKCGRSLRLLEEESSFVSRLENLPRLYCSSSSCTRTSTHTTRRLSRSLRCLHSTPRHTSRHPHASRT